MKDLRNALFLLTSLFTLLLVGCSPPAFEKKKFDAEKTSNLRLIANAQSDVDDHEEELAEIAPQAEPAEAAEAAIQSLSEQIREYTALADELEPRIKEGAVLLESYQKQYQVKNTFAAGEKLGDFTLKSGVAIKGGVITGVRGLQIGIRHESGISYYSGTDLPDQFAGRILTGPERSAASVDIAALFDSKPQAMKTNEQISAERKKEYDAKMQKIEDNRIAHEKEAQRTRAEQDAWMAKREGIKKEMSAVNQEIDQISKAIYNQQIGKANAARGTGSGTIRLSESDRKKRVAPFDRQIGVLEAKRRSLEKKRNEIAERLR